jgi:hypothetical protein
MLVSFFFITIVMDGSASEMVFWSLGTRVNRNCTNALAILILLGDSPCVAVGFERTFRRHADDSRNNDHSYRLPLLVHVMTFSFSLQECCD